MPDINPRDYTVGETGFSVLIANYAAGEFPAAATETDEITPISPFVPRSIAVEFVKGAATSVTIGFKATVLYDLATTAYPLYIKGDTGAQKPIEMTWTANFSGIVPITNGDAGFVSMADWMQGFNGILMYVKAASGTLTTTELKVTVMGSRGYRQYP